MSKSSAKIEDDPDCLRESCRVCLLNLGTIKIFEDSTTLSKMKTCAPIQIDRLDGFPDSLCRKCSKDLDVAFEFYEKCVKSDKRLRKAFPSDLKTKVQIKLEPEEEEEEKMQEGGFWVPVVEKEESPMSKNDIHTLLKSISDRSGLQIKKAPANTRQNRAEEESTIKTKKGENEEKLEKSSKEVIEVEVKYEVKLDDDDNTEDSLWQNVDDCVWEASHDHLGKPRSKRKSQGIYNLSNLTSIRGIYVCDLCNIHFSDGEKFNEHINMHRNETYECVKCKKTIKGTQRIAIHKKTHYDSKMTCEFCGKLYKKAQLERHVAATHMKEYVECDMCGVKVSAKSQLRRHIDNHNSGSEICKICGKEYSSKLSLRMHVERVHMNKKPHTCAYCGHAFHSTKDKKEHENLHTGVKPFECPLCDKTFTQRCNMKSHFVHNHREHDFKLAMELYKNRKAVDH